MVRLIAAIALQDASLYAQALAEVRTLYTSEVVEIVRKHGIAVTHDYAAQEGAIPLPVTLTEPTLPLPPSTAPEPTLTALGPLSPLTTSVPPLTVVAPV